MGMGIRGGGAARQLQALLEAGAVGSMDDGELLGRFLGRDHSAELAFAALVDRHGRMVLRVCRDVLGDPHEAQDAAQATFFILARKAASIRKPEALPSWLHGTARRVATRALRDAIRRRRHERKSAESKAVEGPPAEGSTRGWPELHEELARLPDRYREPIVLCDLAGLTHEQAAGQLGCPARTLEIRLYRGRERLKGRLIRRGVAPSSALVGVAWASETQAARPASWVASTAGAAFRVSGAGGWAAAGEVPVAAVRGARAYLKEMSMLKMKLIAASGLMVGLAAGGVWSRMPDPAGGRPKVQDAPARPAVVVEKLPEPKDAFERAYALADGEDIKALFGPAIQARNEHYRGQWGEVGFSNDPTSVEFSRNLFFRWRGGSKRWFRTSSGPVELRSLFHSLFDIREQEVEGDPALLGTPIPADFLIREGVPAEKLVAQLSTILKRDLGLPIRLSLETERRETVIVEGTYWFQPVPLLTPLPKTMASGGDQIVIYARDLGDPIDFKRSMARGGGDFAQLLSDLGTFIGRRVVDQVESRPKRSLDYQITDSRVMKANSPEDRELVLKHLSEQTGLTFREEPREVRVLHVGRAE